MPQELITTFRPISNEARTLYEGAGYPRDTELVSLAFVLHNNAGAIKNRGFDGTNPLGDPVVFSTYLIGQIANNPGYLANFNLDADRGYGYLCWDWMRRPGTPAIWPQDGQGRTYPPPIVWPEGAPKSATAPSDEAWIRPDPIPVSTPINARGYTPEVQLHYPGRSCRYTDEPGGAERRRQWRCSGRIAMSTKPDDDKAPGQATLTSTGCRARRAADVWWLYGGDIGAVKLNGHMDCSAATQHRLGGCHGR